MNETISEHPADATLDPAFRAQVQALKDVTAVLIGVPSSPVVFSTDRKSILNHGDIAKPVRTLYCCCCGGHTQGRQFHNQDTGYGLGSCCVEYVSKRMNDPVDFERTYGVDGVHYNVDGQALVVAILKTHGWTSVSGGAICLKAYKTAVGMKEALVYLSEGDSFNRSLFGEYQSEGRNALESNTVLIPIGADVTDIYRLTTKFALAADKSVSQTYAAGLLLKNEVE